MRVRDSVAYNILIRDRVRSGRIDDARRIFDTMPCRTAVSWNSMIMGYATSPGGKTMHLALKLFLVMPDHCRDAFSWTIIITGLARGGRAADSVRLFREAPGGTHHPFAWASVLSCLQRNGLPHDALGLFKEMLSSLGAGQPPSPHSVTSALAAAADLPSLFVGRQLFSHVLRRGLGGNTHAGNSVISMFTKCGSLDGARILFRHMPRRDLFTWNSMITGLGRHGLGDEAISTFHLMLRLGFAPDAISFLGVLQGCSHCGRVKEARRYFESMQRDFAIPPRREHYVCLVDVLARAGLLKEATEVISDMPFEATPVLWRALLNGCRIAGDLELGFCVANRVMELEPDNAAACSMFVEMHKAGGRRIEVAMLRESMNRTVRKELGCSWVEIGGKVHLFTTRDETHQETDHIYTILRLLRYTMAGFATQYSIWVVQSESCRTVPSVVCHHPRLEVCCSGDFYFYYLQGRGFVLEDHNIVDGIMSTVPRIVLRRMDRINPGLALA
ncbi:hypothetical protein Taro_002857 [Colocasia esculenta]|uniref:Pentatricopeptide repeat-containing protein n=1 Tax=Colocasia esculenta TaxID=4460 RepID=A0A843TMK7_COLES|nr:hypothetical protein [Colocasia esculenta]